jgi:hypothetical protein
VHIRPGVNSYWVSGSDEQCESKYVWCETDRPFAKWIKWINSENTGAPTNNNCAYIVYQIYLARSVSFSQMMDHGCEVKFKFICEVIH